MRHKIVDVREYSNRWEVDVLFYKYGWFSRKGNKVTFYQRRYGDNSPNHYVWNDTITQESDMKYDSWGILGCNLALAVFNMWNKRDYKALVEETNDKVK